MHKNLDDIKLLHHTGKLAEARRAYLSLLQDNPEDMEVLHLLGLLCAEEGQFDESRAYLNKALAIAPQHAAMRLHLANILKVAGKYDDAVRELQKVIADDPDCSPAFNNLGTVYFARKEYALAMQAYQAALDVRPDYVDAYYNLGLASAKLGRDDEALTAYRALIAIAPEHTGAHFQVGCLLMKRRQIKEAIAEFESILQAHPHHFETLSNLAVCYLQAGHFDQAAATYIRALDVAPDDRDTLFNLAVIHMQQGYAKEAANYYLRAVKAHPDFYDAHHNLGTYFLMARDRENALLHFCEAVRIKPDDEASKHLIRVLMQDPQLKSSAPAYIQSLFNSYADYYDAHMRTHLNYKVPEEIFAAVKTAGVLSATKLDIVDIGCGTGLCGELFKPYAQSLIGVDLSEKMLEAAAQKNIYDQLVPANIVSWLTSQKEKFDLAVAGDVLVYFGEMEDLIAAVKTALKPGGYFAFNVETTNKQHYALTSSGRFAHHLSYLERLAKESGFAMISATNVALRREASGQISGCVCVWQR